MEEVAPGTVTAKGADVSWLPRRAALAFQYEKSPCVSASIPSVKAHDLLSDQRQEHDGAKSTRAGNPVGTLS
eukprot:CAMPEP_0174715642 /NCGR_PEP_ID=MMETSP1094-20130205/21740_1 /TAXON_ID=156173 /ORGANISM="Chrysochromulina brevifilum, Strain UTEX LB 985" /LENGTH=71 /DNA_ID=CAMNT_0015915247 /DNA_START=60 /DNA_END=273 /DNA_ORIENTATION=-